MFKHTALAFVFSAIVSGGAIAGEQYIDQTGFAVSGYDVVSYFDLPQSDIGTPQQSPLVGKAELTQTYNGATFAFASEENLARFRADPSAFVPQYDGHCAFGVAKGSKVPANPTLWRIADGKLYLNLNEKVARRWEKDIPDYIEDAQEEWSDLEPEKASDDAIPDFTSQAPVAN
ncbi:YHS domain-containing (seleno)protein [Albirhodobacter sp. R86504]|uniref:YHS domain-containing (seleno)protein n=1 Tax=Albirhodobacter sp. R86504 TaxID=3093848 RepID=UPI00366D9538